MKAYDIIGYVYAGAQYCRDCIIEQDWTDECTCHPRQHDENGVCQENCTGEGPNPIFANEYDAEYPLICEGCGEELG